MLKTEFAGRPWAVVLIPNEVFRSILPDEPGIHYGGWARSKLRPWAAIRGRCESKLGTENSREASLGKRLQDRSWLGFQTSSCVLQTVCFPHDKNSGAFAGIAGVPACMRPTDADEHNNFSTSRLLLTGTPGEPALQAGTPAVQSVGTEFSACSASLRGNGFSPTDPENCGVSKQP